jgi:hypothetical protein
MPAINANVFLSLETIILCCFMELKEHLKSSQMIKEYCLNLGKQSICCLYVRLII